MQKDNFPEFTEWQKTHDMPEGFSNSSWHNDVFPSISNENGTVRVWFQSVEGFVSELDGKIADFNKYYIQMHETDEIYGLDNYEDPKYSELYTNDWNEVLNAIKSFNNLKMLDEFVITDKTTNEFIEKFFNVGQELGYFYLSIGIDMRDGLDYFDMNDFHYIASEMAIKNINAFHSESQFKYISNYLMRLSIIWESKDI